MGINRYNFCGEYWAISGIKEYTFVEYGKNVKEYEMEFSYFIEDKKLKQYLVHFKFIHVIYDF